MRDKRRPRFDRRLEASMIGNLAAGGPSKILKSGTARDTAHRRSTARQRSGSRAPISDTESPSLLVMAYRAIAWSSKYRVRRLKQSVIRLKRHERIINSKFVLDPTWCKYSETTCGGYIFAMEIFLAF